MILSVERSLSASFEEVQYLGSLSEEELMEAERLYKPMVFSESQLYDRKQVKPGRGYQRA
jgi:hypothetical protein